MFSTTPIIAPVYYIVSGTKKDEGVILARDRDTVDEVTTLNSSKKVWCLV